jgi:hypothetical protein
MATYTDNFNRATESPLSGNWAAFDCFGTYQLEARNNCANVITNGQWSGNIYSGGALENDQHCQVKKGGTVNNVAPAPLVRCTVVAGANNDTGYICLFSGSYLNSPNGAGALYRMSGATWTQIGSTWTPSSGNYDGDGPVAKVDATGTTFTAYWSGVQQAQRTDGTYGSGYAGLGYYSTSGSGSLDDWEASDIGISSPFPCFLP